MKIAIDISPVVYETGVSVYTRCLVKNLLKLDKTNHYLIFGGSLRRRMLLKQFVSILPEATNFRLLPMAPTMADFFWNRLHTIPLETFSGTVDVYHSSDWAQAPSRAFKVTTIHDTSPFLRPDLTHPAITAVHKRRFDWVKKEVDQVIVPSKAVKEEVVGLGIPPERVTVIYEALDPETRKEKQVYTNRILRNLRLSKYLLAVGANKRKNTSRIIDAFKRYNQKQDYKLVVIGENRDFSENNRDVVFTGHIPKRMVNALYSRAKALIYPSLMEGFGLPILEAFFFNVPVVTSLISSMPEIAGDAAILVDPNSVDDISQGIKKAIVNAGKLGRMGQNRLKAFTWQNTASETLKIYQKAKEK